MIEKITSEIQKLAPSAIIEVFELNGQSIGASSYYFHAGTNELNQDIVWQGQTYVRFPIEASGFETSGQGQLPRPKLKVSNYMSAITAILLSYNDLVGAKIIRKRTLKKYLDAVNFQSGNPSADSTAAFPDDIFYIDRKVSESRDLVEFELISALDLAGIKLPRRQIISNVCTWKYRGGECGYTGSNYFLADDTQTTLASEDACGKRLSSCKARFGETASLPFGGFPGSGLVK